MAPPRAASSAPYSRGVEKYGSDGLLLSSAGRRWSGRHAELHRHGAGVIEFQDSGPDVEICIDVCGNGAMVSRHHSNGVDQGPATLGVTCLTSPASRASVLTISDPLPGILHRASGRADDGGPFTLDSNK